MRRRPTNPFRWLTPAQKGTLSIFLALLLGAHVKLEISDDAQTEEVRESAPQAEVRR